MPKTTIFVEEANTAFATGPGETPIDVASGHQYPRWTPRKSEAGSLLIADPMVEGN